LQVDLLVVVVLLDALGLVHLHRGRHVPAPRLGGCKLGLAWESPAMH